QRLRRTNQPACPRALLAPQTQSRRFSIKRRPFFIFNLCPQLVGRTSEGGRSPRRGSSEICPISANLSGAALTNALRCRRTVSVCAVLRRAKRGRFAYFALKFP